MTKLELAERVLQKLMVLEHQEVMDSGDSTIVTDAYDSAYSLLEANKLTTWGMNDDIPESAALSMIDYVANRVKYAFSVPADIRQVLPFDAAQAEIDLASLLFDDYVTDVTSAEYY